MLDMHFWTHERAAEAIICYAEVQGRPCSPCCRYSSRWQRIVTNPASRLNGSLSGVDHMLEGSPKSGCQRLGQQLLVPVEEGDGALAVQRGSSALALVQQGDDPLCHGGRQAGAMLCS